MLNPQDIEILNLNFIDKFGIEEADKREILSLSSLISLKKGEILYEKTKTCYGYIMMKSGVLRVFVSSSNLKEITVFTIKQGESCMMCADCIVESFNKELNIEVVEDCEFILIPNTLFKRLKDRYKNVANHATMLIASRFNAVVNVLELALFAPLHDRIRNFLQENSVNGIVKITHDEIANNLGSAREAISRVLKEMEKDGKISQSRGKIEIIK